MGLIEGDDLLAVALSDVAALGTDRDRDQVTAIGDRLRSARLRVLVAGEAKRGKSTLVNAFLGQPVLPVGVTPLTAVATTVRYGDNPHAEVRFADGHEERHPYSALDDLVTAGYLKAVPKDPITGRTDTWITSQSDTLSTVDQTQGGIDDVHSGAQVTATDGSSYNTW